MLCSTGSRPTLLSRNSTRAHREPGMRFTPSVAYLPGFGALKSTLSGVTASFVARVGPLPVEYDAEIVRVVRSGAADGALERDVPPRLLLVLLLALRPESPPQPTRVTN